jgi:hypothetical protein
MSERFLRGALVFTFLAHGAAMLGMLAFLMPLVPGGGGPGDDLARVIRIAGSPVAYRLGWLGWQITAASDLVLAAALLRMTTAGTPPRRIAIVAAILVVLAVIPDQTAQLLLVTRGVELAREGAQQANATEFLVFEDVMFPLTSGWAALLYTLGAIGWALTLRASGLWSRPLAWLSTPMLALFVAISIAPILPVEVRPNPALIGGGNEVAFTLLEGWFVAAWAAVGQASDGLRGIRDPLA